MCLICSAEESDDDEDRPSRRRRLGERAAEGMEQDGDEVTHDFQLSLNFV